MKDGIERKQAPTRAGINASRPLQVAPRQTGIYERNFGLLNSDSSWRSTWWTIIAGKFTSCPYSGLLFVEKLTQYAELYDTDGTGRIQAPFLRQFNPLGDRTTWTHIIPGFFGPSGFTGLLLYDQAAGFGCFYDSNGQGDFVLRSQYSGWRTSWTHIVSGRFVSSSNYSSIFFYSASENYGEIWAFDGTGLVGNTPYQTFADFWSSPFTHVLSGEFHWTPGFIDEVPTLTDLFFYNAASGYGELYRSDMTGAASSIVPTPCATSNDLPRQASCVIADNFGGSGYTDLCFYGGSSGTLSFYSFSDTSDTTAEIVLYETQSGLGKTANLIVAGKFWMPNPEDHWFNDGPVISATPPFDPEWRFGSGGFSDLLLYDRNAGLGQFYFHEPLPPTVPALDGYITSQTSHGSPNSALVCTGSVTPGELISFHISSQGGAYSITIYRQTIFAGQQTEQRMAAIHGLPAAPAAFPIGRLAYQEGANWPSVGDFTVPAEWPSGLYIARVETAGTNASTIDLPFVVRAPSAARSPVLLVLADCTYCAYNYWGGRNSYGHLTGDNFAGAYPSTSSLRIPFGLQLSFERPQPQNGGWGNVPESWEVPFLLWLSRRGVPFDVCTSRDLHFEAPDRSHYQLLLFAGHHEYWTAEMRNSVESFVTAGGNVAFFSGNVSWWQIRLSPDGRQLLCYKVSGLDPVSTTADHALTTVHWFDDLVKRPETAMTGVSWNGNDGIYYDQDHLFELKQAGHWVFAGTGLNNGDTFGGYDAGGGTQNSVAGPETDRVQSDGPNGLTSPPNYTLASIYDLVYPTLEVGTMGIFKPAGGGAGSTFNAATIDWALGLNHDEHTWNVIDQITLNVISNLGPPRPSPWTSVSEGGSTPGAPITAVRNSQGLFNIFLADPGGGVYTTSGDNSHGWQPWTSVSQGQCTPGGNITAVVTAPNRIALFLADPNGGVYSASGSPADGWGPWSSVSDGSTTPGAPITAIVTAQNQIIIFLADPEGGVYTNSTNSNGLWQEWTPVPGITTTPGATVAAVVTGTNQIDLFLADRNGGIYTTSGNASNGWQPWTSVSQGQCTPGGNITAIVTGPNRFTLFLADPEGGVYTASGNSTDGWGPWTNVAAGQTTPGARVAALVSLTGRAALFIADSAGIIYSTSGNPTDGWQPWASVSEGSSTPGAPVTAVMTTQMQAALFLSDPGGGIYTATTGKLS